MARQKVGGVYKSKDPTKANYAKIDLQDKGSITLKHGDYLQVESKVFQQKMIAAALEAGRLTPEHAEKALARLEKMPDYVLGELIMVTT